MVDDPKSPPPQDAWQKHAQFNQLLNDPIIRNALQTVCHSLQRNVFIDRARFGQSGDLVVPFQLFKNLLTDAQLIPAQTSLAFNIGLHLTVSSMSATTSTTNSNSCAEDSAVLDADVDPNSITSPSVSPQLSSPPTTTATDTASASENSKRANSNLRDKRGDNDPNQTPLTFDAFLDALVFSAYFYSPTPTTTPLTALDADTPSSWQPTAELLREHVIHFANTLLNHTISLSSMSAPSPATHLQTPCSVSPMAGSTPTTAQAPVPSSAPTSSPDLRDGMINNTPSVAYRTPAATIRPFNRATRSIATATPMPTPANLFFTPASRLPPSSSAGSTTVSMSNTPASAIPSPSCVPTPAVLRSPSSSRQTQSPRLPSTQTASRGSKLPAPPPRPSSLSFRLEDKKRSPPAYTASSSVSPSPTGSASTATTMAIQRSRLSAPVVSSTSKTSTVSPKCPVTDSSDTHSQTSRMPSAISAESDVASLPNAPTPPGSPMKSSPKTEAASHLQTPNRCGAANNYSPKIQSPILRDPVVGPGAASVSAGNGVQQQPRALNFVDLGPYDQVQEKARDITGKQPDNCCGTSGNNDVGDDDSLYEEDGESSVSAAHLPIVRDARCQAVLAGEFGRPVEVDEQALERSEKGIYLESDVDHVANPPKAEDSRTETECSDKKKTSLRFDDGVDGVNQHEKDARRSSDFGNDVGVYVCVRELGSESGDSADALCITLKGSPCAHSAKTSTMVDGNLLSDSKDIDGADSSQSPEPNSQICRAVTATPASDVPVPQLTQDQNEANLEEKINASATSVHSTSRTSMPHSGSTATKSTPATTEKHATTPSTTESSALPRTPAKSGTRLYKGQATPSAPIPTTSRSATALRTSRLLTDEEEEEEQRAQEVERDFLRNPATGRGYDTSFEDNSEAFLKDCGLWSPMASPEREASPLLHGAIQGATPLQRRLAANRRASSAIGTTPSKGLPPMPSMDNTPSHVDSSHTTKPDNTSQSASGRRVSAAGSSPLLASPRGLSMADSSTSTSSLFGRSIMNRVNSSNNNNSPSSSSGSDFGVTGLAVVRKQTGWPSALRRGGASASAAAAAARRRVSAPADVTASAVAAAEAAAASAAAAKTAAAAQEAVMIAGAEAAAAAASAAQKATEETRDAVVKLVGTGAQAADEVVRLLGECVEAQRAMRAEVAMVRVDVARARRRLGGDLIDGMLAAVVIMVGVLAIVAWHSSSRGFAYV